MSIKSSNSIDFTTAANIESVEIKEEQKSIKLSVSIGVAEFPTDAKNSQEILTIADRMMYEAKESGRGVVFNTKDIFKSSLKNDPELSFQNR
jgi:diguanylate cyclase (GGDEF)-like protein